MIHRILPRLLLICTLLITPYAFSSPELKVYSITQVKAGDSLNIRAWPSSQSTVIHTIPHNGQWIASNRKPIKKGSESWQKILWNGTTGWVNRKYLKYDAEKTLKAKQRRNHRLKRQSFSRNAPKTPKSRPAKRAKISKQQQSKPRQAGKRVIIECGGNSPFWNVSMDFEGKNLKVDLRDGKPFTSPLYFRKWIKNSTKMVVNGGNGRNAVRATLNKTNTCTDGITHIKYPFEIKTTIGAGKQVLQGCCRSVHR